MLPTAVPPPDAPPAPRGAAQPAQAMINARFGNSAPLSVFTVPRTGRPRISIVTDSISKGSLFGGVGTALILGTLLANRMGADLRIITRTDEGQGFATE